ncbi:MAG: DUF2848 family protein [Nitrososphaerota archaeon]|nr:DUF2848 family protein [Nitrososphaerota archaeon]
MKSDIMGLKGRVKEMVKKIDLIVRSKGGLGRLEFEVRRLLLAGYSGRDQESVKKHIEELMKIGVPVPSKVPTIFSVPPYLLTCDEKVEVCSEKTSGEVEYVILIDKGKMIYVTVGSDHTDRWLEKVDILSSKWMYRKVIAKEVWIYDEIKDHWDEIIIESYIGEEWKKELYQRAKLKALLSVEDLMRIFNIREEGVILFSGTIPTLSSEIIYSPWFEVSIYDPILERRITTSYRVEVIKP